MKKMNTAKTMTTYTFVGTGDMPFVFVVVPSYGDYKHELPGYNSINDKEGHELAQWLRTVFCNKTLEALKEQL